jgi:hypothetical protein
MFTLSAFRRAATIPRSFANLMALLQPPLIVTRHHALRAIIPEMSA